MAVAAQATKRIASLSLTKAASGLTLTASLPKSVSAHDFGTLSNQIIDVIRGHTGCACLSGQIRVVLEEQMADIVHVQLGPIAVGKGG